MEINAVIKWLEDCVDLNYGNMEGTDATEFVYYDKLYCLFSEALATCEHIKFTVEEFEAEKKGAK